LCNVRSVDSVAARGGIAMSDLIWLSAMQMRRIECPSRTTEACGKRITRLRANLLSMGPRLEVPQA
jgi:hypothetical protein